MNSSTETTFSQNTILPIKENRVIILTELHSSKEAIETWQKIMDLMSLKKMIALDESICFGLGINKCHLPLEDLRIKELGQMMIDLRDFRNFGARQETGSGFIRSRINNENKISKNAIYVLRLYLNTFNLVLNSFVSNDELKNQIENKFHQQGRINTTALIALSERTFPAADKLYKEFSCTEDTFATDENVEKLINIANELFNSMPKIVDFYTTFFNEQAKLVLKSSPEYFPFFSNISKVLTNEIPAFPFTSTMRNVGMAKNIHSALNNFDSDIIVRVGQAHTVDCYKNYQTSIATILQKNHKIQPTRIVHQFVGPGFDLEAFLSDCNFKFHQT